ncbi:MAG: nucleotidyltransferase, partial [Clostridiales bacterium]|nr:nucleotidyltransferase [Clostridiales bacterium]
NNDDNAPISIIITTLAARAYNGEKNVYEALCNILNHMHEYIERKDGVYWVKNPVMEEENFADKWELYPKRKDNFYKWLCKAKEDLISNPLAAVGIDLLGEIFKESLGEAPVSRAFHSYADDMLSARKKGTLYSVGLTSGLTTKVTSKATQVKEHTFFGK